MERATLLTVLVCDIEGEGPNASLVPLSASTWMVSTEYADIIRGELGQPNAETPIDRATGETVMGVATELERRIPTIYKNEGHL